jgi:hypothetical protein
MRPSFDGPAAAPLPFFGVEGLLTARIYQDFSRKSRNRFSIRTAIASVLLGDTPVLISAYRLAIIC